MEAVMKRKTIQRSTVACGETWAPCPGRDTKGWLLLESYIAALKVKEKTFLTDDTYLMDGVVIELERFF
jgi:hypothetical protein